MNMKPPLEMLHGGMLYKAGYAFRHPDTDEAIFGVLAGTLLFIGPRIQCELWLRARRLPADKAKQLIDNVLSYGGQP